MLIRDNIRIEVDRFNLFSLNDIDSAIALAIDYYGSSLVYDSLTGKLSSGSEKETRKIYYRALSSLLNIAYTEYTVKAINQNDDINVLDLRERYKALKLRKDYIEAELKKYERKPILSIS